MKVPYFMSILFVAISVIFLGIAFRDFLKAEGKLTISRRIWLRMAFIFAGVAIALFFLHNFFG